MTEESLFPQSAESPHIYTCSVSNDANTEQQDSSLD